MARSRTVVGSHVVVYVNGSLFGRVAEVRFTSETPQRSLHVVDWLPPVELIDQGVDLRGNMRVYRLHKDGGAEAAGMAGVWADLTRAKYWSILLVDRSTDTVIFRADRCKTTSQSWSVGRGHVMGDISWQSLDWSNETQPSST